MTLTIPAFWCGVIATFIAEAVAVIIAAVIRARKIKPRKNKIK